MDWVTVAAVVPGTALQLWQVFIGRQQVGLARQQLTETSGEPFKPTRLQNERARAIRRRHGAEFRRQIGRRLLVPAESAEASEVIDEALLRWIEQGGADRRRLSVFWSVFWVECCIDEIVVERMDNDYVDATKRCIPLPGLTFAELINMSLSAAHQHVRLMPRSEREVWSERYLRALEEVGETLLGDVFE